MYALNSTVDEVPRYEIIIFSSLRHSNNGNDNDFEIERDFHFNYVTLPSFIDKNQ
jgi:hypothetical protein